jgi:hypothetical protein
MSAYSRYIRSYFLYEVLSEMYNLGFILFLCIEVELATCDVPPREKAYGEVVVKWQYL